LNEAKTRKLKKTQELDEQALELKNQLEAAH
jgi:hypothetical protein